MSLTLAVSGKLPEGVDRKTLAKAVKTVTELVEGPVPDGVINLKLVDDAAIQALNKKYGSSDNPTDVLSFNYHEDGSEPLGGELGDIAISLETAARQALAAQAPLETEVTLLLIHGTLHILGFDHATTEDRTAMDALQLRIMNQLGLTYRNFAWDSSTA